MPRTRNLEELKKQYPRLWEKAQKKVTHLEAQKKLFFALIEAQKAKELEKQLRARERTKHRRYRAKAIERLVVCLMEDNVSQTLYLEAYHQESGRWYRVDLKDYINKLIVERRLILREGRREIDLSPFLFEELTQAKKRRGLE